MAKRAAKPRPVDRGADLPPEAGPTFAETIEQQGLLPKMSGLTRELIAAWNREASEHVRVRLKVIGCDTCREPACCSQQVGAYLHEVVPIVARLLAEGRDTPELRATLREVASAMESTPRGQYRRPCVFLDADKRCSVYDDRPSLCGIHLVESPPEACSAPDGLQVMAIQGEGRDSYQRGYEELFALLAGLRPIETLYWGALPRMVLLCLEAWHRRDFAPYLAARVLPAAHRLRAATR